MLDLARGLSAFAVFLGHLRSSLLVDYPEVQDPTLVHRTLYFALGLGHEAVMVFFVMSGYLIGGAALAAILTGRFSPGRYALARLTRLYVVLVPALALTLLVDSVGQSWFPTAYQGSLLPLLNSGPAPEAHVDLTARTLFGNLLFLQTIAVPLYGSNKPLWSLANEFWYYALFPVLCFGVVVAGRRELVRAALPLAIGLAGLAWLPVEIVIGGLVWLMGVAVHALAPVPGVRRVVHHPVYRGSSFALFLGSLLAASLGWPIGHDLVVGLAFSLWLVSVCGVRLTAAWWDVPARWSAEVSYTLYVVHFPLVFMAGVLLLSDGAGQQLPPTAAGLGVYLGYASAVLAITVVLWACFERHTQFVRNALARRLFRGSRTT